MSFLSSSDIRTLRDAAREYIDHEGINEAHVAAWSRQFGNNNQELALKILKNIKYFSGTKIRKMVEVLLGKVRNELGLDITKTLFVPIGSPAEGSAVVTRALRDVSGIRTSQIKYQSDLANIPEKTAINAIVFLDVFSGTGGQLESWWQNVEALFLPWKQKKVKLVIGLIAMNYKARKRLKRIPIDKVWVCYFDRRYNIFHERSTYFLKSEQKAIKKYCRITQCGEDYLWGWGQCALLVAFKHGCPNNSLPILWRESPTWTKLFRRRAI